MINSYNYNLLKEDIKAGKQIVLFLGAGINYCENYSLLWSDTMSYLFKYVISHIVSLENITSEELDLLKQLFNISAKNIEKQKDSELYRYVQDEFPIILQAYIVKQILGKNYISIIQDFLYSRCNSQLLNKAFMNNHIIGAVQNTIAKKSDYPCLFEIARLILLCPNIKAVVTYNYDNFLSQAIKIIQSHPDKFFNEKELILYNNRCGTQNNISLDIQDIYGDKYNSVIKRNTIPVYHVHGYIPSPDEINVLDENSIVLSMDEYYDNTRNVYCWQTDTQMHLLSHYTCVFIGSSMSDITIQRMLYYAQHYGNNERIYCFSSQKIRSDLTTADKNIYRILKGIKQDFFQSYGVTMITSDKGYDKLYEGIHQLVEI